MTIETTLPCRGSYIEWATIVAGTVLALAITAVLIQFGAVVGLTQIDFDVNTDANINPGMVLATGIWFLWVQLLSSLAGGYLAGRMRAPIASATEHERDMRDGVHGLLVWATSTILVVLAVSAASAVAALADNPVEDVVRTADVAAMQEKATIIFAFFAASTSLVSGVVSWWAATAGGDHRDTGIDHTRYFTFRTRAVR
jgi:hypothetical protein